MLNEHSANFNDEARMTNDEASPNAQMIESAIALSHHSGFVIPSSFVIRHSSLKAIFRRSFPAVHLSDLLHGQD